MDFGDGPFTQAAAGVLRRRARGAALGSGYSRLNTRVAATLNGLLEVSIVDDFQPAVNSMFGVLGYGSRAGAFATINVTGLPAGRSITPEYRVAELRLLVQ